MGHETPARMVSILGRLGPIWMRWAQDGLRTDRRGCCAIRICAGGWIVWRPGLVWGTACAACCDSVYWVPDEGSKHRDALAVSWIVTLQSHICG